MLPNAGKSQRWQQGTMLLLYGNDHRLMPYLNVAEDGCFWKLQLEFELLYADYLEFLIS